MRWLLLTVAMLIGLHAKSETWTPLTAETKLEGAFRAGGTDDSVVWEDARNQSRATFGSGPQGTELGSFCTNVFRAPPQFRCFLAGFPRSNGISIYLRDEKTGRKLPLGSSLDPALTWQERIWVVPPAWRNHPVRLQIDDRSTDPQFGWIALTLPESGSHAWWLPFARAGYRSIFLLLELSWFLLPGIAIALALAPKNTVQFAAVVLTGAAVTGYALLWVYLANPKAGAIASGIALALATGLIWRLRRPFPKELALLFVGVALTASFYNSVGFLFYTEDGPGEMAQARFSPNTLPPDNLLQFLFAWDIYNGKSVRPFLFANSRSSDRPPLETALTLAQWPFWRLLSLPHSYQLLGVALQCLWTVSVWILMRAGGLPPPAMIGTLALIFFTGFAWEHSFYIWPKLLSASFCLIGMALIPAFRGDTKPWSFIEAVTASAAFSLSLLSHAGSGFTVLAIVAYLAFRRRLPSFRLSVWAILVALLLLLPWHAYQVLADPPGNSLMKLHLAGITDDQLSLGDALLRGYGDLGLSQVIGNKVANFKALVVWLDWSPGNGLTTMLLNLRNTQFFAFFPCAGLLNLGLLARLRLPKNIASGKGCRPADGDRAPVACTLVFADVRTRVCHSASGFLCDGIALFCRQCPLPFCLVPMVSMDHRLDSSLPHFSGSRSIGACNYPCSRASLE